MTTVALVLLAVAVIGPVLWATVYRAASPEHRSATELLQGAVVGRWLNWGAENQHGRRR